MGLLSYRRFNGCVWFGVGVSAAAAFALTPEAVTGGGSPPRLAPAPDDIGAVISSFRLTGLAEPYALGIYRDPSYVYGIVYSGGPDYLYRYTAGGTRVGSYELTGTATPRGADRSHLGSGYLALVDAVKRKLFVFRTTGGSPAASFAVAGSPYPLNCFKNGPYYYVNGSSDRGTFYRYTTNGSAAGTWTCAGWPDAMTYCSGASLAHRGNNAEGPYLVACSWRAGEPMCMTTFPGGSLVSTWTTPNYNGNGLAYGDASQPSTYGAAVWATWYTGAALYAVEFDVEAGGGASVAPASVGRIKALYR